MFKTRDHKDVTHEVGARHQSFGIEPDGFYCDDMALVCCELGEVQSKFVNDKDELGVDVAAL